MKDIEQNAQQDRSCLNAQPVQQPAPLVGQEQRLCDIQRCEHKACGRYQAGTSWECRAERDNACARQDTSPASAASAQPFQQRVQPWLMACFGEKIAGDREERNHRFLEESLELVQACGCAASEAHQLVDYVFGRPVGEPAQEVGGVMVTLAALCLAQDLDMHAAGETELARIWTKVKAIRTKQAAKPKHSPLPAAEPQVVADELDMQTIRERDYNAEMADKLADAVAEHFGVDIGEHSSANCPWVQALDLLNTKREFIDCAGSKRAAAPVQAQEPFMYAIMDPDGNAYYEEHCVDPTPDALYGAINALNDSPDTGYKVVPLYAAPVQPVAVPDVWISELVGGIADELSYGHGYRQGFNDCRTKALAMNPAAPAAQHNAKDACAEMRALCSACGGTGDVHSIDGEWRGQCTCVDAWRQRAEKAEARAKELEAQLIRRRTPPSPETQQAVAAARAAGQSFAATPGGLVFMNDGAEPDYSKLDCPACGGSGHADDVKAGGAP